MFFFIKAISHWTNKPQKIFNWSETRSSLELKIQWKRNNSCRLYSSVVFNHFLEYLSISCVFVRFSLFIIYCPKKIPLFVEILFDFRSIQSILLLLCHYSENNSSFSIEFHTKLISFIFSSASLYLHIVFIFYFFHLQSYS